MKLKTMEDLFIDQVKDLLSAENQILKALPKMAKSAESEELCGAFEEHYDQTEQHVKRLQKILKRFDAGSKGKKCKGMEGLLAEGKELLDMDADPDVMDAALIAAAQRVEHYEIASYGCARTYARLLGDEEAERLLQETLDEEAETDKKLTELAENSINVRAVAAEA